MSVQEMWKDPMSGKIMPFKVGGAKVSPTFRDDDVFDQLPSLRSSSRGARPERYGSLAASMEVTLTPTERARMEQERIANNAETEGEMASHMTVAEWDEYVSAGANEPAPIPESLRGLSPEAISARGRRPVRRPAMSPTTDRRPGATPRGTRRATAPGSTYQQGAAENRDRISRLMESLRIGR